MTPPVDPRPNATDDGPFTTSMIRRAEPLPALPPEMPGPTLTLTVPVSFALR